MFPTKFVEHCLFICKMPVYIDVTNLSTIFFFINILNLLHLLADFLVLLDGQS